MEENERKPVKAEPADSSFTAASSDAPSDAVPDWRSQFSPQSRQKVINKIIETFKKTIPLNSESYNGLKDIVLKFEGKMYASATSQNDYLQKISLKMITMEVKTSNTGQTNPSTSNSANGNQTPADSASLGTQSQVSNQEQLLAVPLINQSPASQYLLSENPHNATISVALQDSRGLSLATPSTGGITGSTSNMPNLSSLDIYANVQRQIQGRQQQLPKENQHQSQSSFDQLQQQIVKQKFQQPSILRPHLKQPQLQQQQQYLLQSPQPLSSPKSLMQMSSGLQSGQSGMEPTQSATMQTARMSTIQQNQLNSVQQSEASLLQKHPQLIPRQLQQHISSHQQEPSTIPQHASLASSQQQLQHLMGKKPDMLNMQQIQLLGQKKDVPEMQQPQRLPMQQNDLLNMWQPQQTLNQLGVSLHQQPQLGPQTNITGLQQQEQKQQQQQQLVDSLPNVPEVQLNPCQMQAIQQTQAATQQRQHQIQPAQQLVMQQNLNSLHGEAQQRFQTSGSFLHSQSAIEHQNQCFQPQRVFPDVSFSTSMDSTSQNATTVNWQEEICQKLKSMKELYLMELDAFHQKIVLRLQQIDSLTPLEKQSEYYSKLKYYKSSFEYAIAFLQMTKNNIPPLVRDRFPQYEKRINQLVSIARSKKGAPPQPQKQLQYPGGHTPSIIQQLPSQVSELPQHDGYIKKAQEINMQGSVPSFYSSTTSSMQHGSMPLLKHSDVLGARKNTGETLHTNYNLNADQKNSCSSMQQGAVVSVLQAGLRSLQNMSSAPQQTNTLPQNSMITRQPNESAMQLSHVMVQQQNLKQQEEEQKMMQEQPMKQHLRQYHMQQQEQQFIQQQQKKQLLQQQPLLQLHQQQKQQKMSQLSVYQMAHQQLNEFSDLKARQESGIKLGMHQKHFSASQNPNFCHQQLNLGGILPISPPQNFQASSPPLLQSPSPEVYNPSLLPSLTKSGMPLQSANSPFALPSPSTQLSSSSVTVDSEKQLNHTSTLSNVGCNVHQQTALGPVQVQSLAIVTPGISASPLLAEFTGPDKGMAIVQSGKPRDAEQPVERLIKAVQSLSPDVLRFSVNDMGSVVSMINSIGCSAPGNSSRAAIGEDLAAMANCHLEATMTKNMRHCITAMPFNNVPSTGSMTHISRESFCLDASELESTATSSVKRQRFEQVNQNIAEEIKEINRQLIDTVVSTCSGGVDSIAAAGEGTVVEFSFAAVTLSPNLRSHFASAHMSPVMPLKLFVPSGYPRRSPVLLDELPAEQRSSEVFQDLSCKVRSRFSATIRGLSQPMSLWEMARTWDTCSRKVITEYAAQNGGGSFSSIYGSWENCAGA